MIRPVTVVLSLLVLTGCASTRTAGAGSASTPSAPISTPSPVTTTARVTPSPSSSNPAEPKTSTTTSAGPSVQSLIDRLDGNWSGHGRDLTLSSGHGLITYRVYKWCADDPTPPCDEMQGNEIIDGGRVVFRLSTAYVAGTATIAQGQLLSSTDSTVPVGALTVREYHDLLTLSVFPDTPFCDAQLRPLRVRSMKIVRPSRTDITSAVFAVLPQVGADID